MICVGIVGPAKTCNVEKNWFTLLLRYLTDVYFEASLNTYEYLSNKLTIPLNDNISSPEDGDEAGEPVKVGDAGL